MDRIKSIGIIMDGNRRWAKACGKSAWDGHRAGADIVFSLGEASAGLRERWGLEYVTLYTFSTENWSRTPEEVSFLLSLIREKFVEFADWFVEHGIRMKIVGDRSRFSNDMQKLFIELEKKTEAGKNFTVAFALSYGGRTEILDAVNRLIAAGTAVDEKTFSDTLWMGQSGIPDPEIIIRTSGEMRTSGFLPWQSVYSELFFTDTLWPDFTVTELEKIFSEYQSRERRRGK